ncbi:MAG TPA: hypothetical protein VFY87_07350 [Geminicoccaceae bacterium]|nr:hypothetical protein [Geminicoccaceae bacterium]
MNAQRGLSPLTTIAFAGVLAGAVLPGQALACASEDRIALAEMGYTSEQIDAQCGSGGNPFVTPSMPAAQLCMTAAGSCYLGEFVAVGDSCWCPTGYGDVAQGVAR